MLHGGDDQLFVLVNAGSTVARALTRDEWLQCIIRAGAMRYVQGGGCLTVAEGVRKLISEHMTPQKLDPSVFQDSNQVERDMSLLSWFL